MKKFLAGLAAAIGLGVASWGAIGAPGVPTLSSLSGSYIITVDPNGATLAQSTLTTLSGWIAQNLGGTSGVTCSGTTTATCNGTAFTVSITGLTTAAGASSAAMVVTNSNVTSSRPVICQPQGYAGGGTPVAVAVTPGSSQVSLKIANVAGTGALDATVAIFCQVF